MGSGGGTAPPQCPSNAACIVLGGGDTPPARVTPPGTGTMLEAHAGIGVRGGFVRGCACGGGYLQPMRCWGGVAEFGGEHSELARAAGRGLAAGAWALRVRVVVVGRGGTVCPAWAAALTWESAQCDASVPAW